MERSTKHETERKIAEESLKAAELIGARSVNKRDCIINLMDIDLDKFWGYKTSLNNSKIIFLAE